MVLTVTQNWIDAMLRADVEIRYLLILDLAGPVTFRCVDGPCDLIDAPEAIESIGSIPIEMSPEDRHVEVGSNTLHIQDGFIRPILLQHRIKGQRATIKIGTKELAEADFAPYFVGPIHDYKPSAGTGMDLEVRDVLSILRKRKIQGDWIGLHPLEVILDILTKAGIDSSLFDATTLDKSQPEYAEISHLVVTRATAADWYVDTAVRELTSAFALIDQLAILLNGHLIPDGDGVLRFKLFDPTPLTDDSWTFDDYRADIKQTAIAENIINQVVVNFRPDQAGNFAEQFVRNDTASQAAHAYPGTSEQIYSKKIDTKWIIGISVLRTSIPDAVSTAAVVFGGSYNQNLTGLNGAKPGPQPAECALSASRPGYFQIEDEIIEVRSLTADANSSVVINRIDPVTGASDPINPGVGTATTGAIIRGALGTTAAAHTQPLVIKDVTLAAFFALRILNRQSEGLDKIEVETDFSKWPLTVGSIVSVVYPEFLSFNRDGIGPVQIWEVLKKDPKPDDRPPTCLWTMGFVRDNVVSAVIVSTSINVGSQQENFNVGFGSLLVTQPYIINGLVLTDGGGLNVDISAGSAGTGTVTHTLDVPVTVAVPATVTINFFFNTQSGNIIFRETGQTPEAFEVHLGEVITAGAALTSISGQTIDDREQQPVIGTNIQENSVSVRAVNREEDQNENLIPNAQFSQASLG